MADSLRSPFNTVLHNLPQGHEKAFKQALYTTAANIFVLFAGAAAIAVFFILEAFLRPLLWAVLCGTFLYPFKRSLTSVLRSWLKGLHDSRTPFVIGIAMIPVNVLDNTYETLYSKFSSNIKIISACVVSVVILYLMWHFGPLYSIFSAISSIFMFIYEVLGYFSTFWIWTLIVGFVLAVAFLWSPQSQQYFKYISVLVWFVLVLHVATAAGSLRVPLFILLIAVITIGFVTELKEAKKELEDKYKNVPLSASLRWMAFGDDKKLQEMANSGDQDEGASEGEMVEDVLDGQQSADPDVKKPSNLNLRSSLKSSSSRQKLSSVPKRSLSDTCFLGLIWALVLTRIYLNVWVLQLLLPIGIFIWLFKYFSSHLGEGGLLGNRVAAIKSAVSDWFMMRRDVLAPRWITGVLKLLSRGDAKIISVLEQSMDQATSVMFILLLLVGSVLFSVFCAIQLQQESMHLVKVSGDLFNRTGALSEYLPNSEYMQDTLDSMVGNAYLYGRQWIATRVRDLVSSDSESNNTHLEKQVLDVWDRLYDSWLARNITGSENNAVSKPGQSLDLLDWNSMYEFLTDGSKFNYGQIINFVKENLGTFTSVLESVWMVLKGNMSLVLNLVTAALSVVLGGGTAIINFIISAAIFLTTLFYLLASSGKQFKPMEWMSNLNPTQSGSKLSTAMEEAIAGVFMASLKMAAFYGLYTWLTHSLFGINIVFIPCILAAIFAAVPFLGTYWAALPAVLELWLINGEGLKALFLFICHLLPLFVVDTAIYKEIKGGHPYMTGLAIAGGIYWMGLEGAIIGPILLCCLIVAFNVYSTMLQSDSTTNPPGLGLLMNATRSAYCNRNSLPGSLNRSLSTDPLKR